MNYFADSIVSHWSPKIPDSEWSFGLEKSKDFDLTDDGGILKVYHHGLYLIYSQVKIMKLL